MKQLTAPMALKDELQLEELEEMVAPANDGEALAWFVLGVTLVIIFT